MLHTAELAVHLRPASPFDPAHPPTPRLPAPCPPLPPPLPHAPLGRRAARRRAWRGWLRPCQTASGSQPSPSRTPTPAPLTSQPPPASRRTSRQGGVAARAPGAAGQQQGGASGGAAARLAPRMQAWLCSSPPPSDCYPASRTGALHALSPPSPPPLLPSATPSHPLRQTLAIPPPSLAQDKGPSSRTFPSSPPLPVRLRQRSPLPPAAACSVRSAQRPLTAACIAARPAAVARVLLHRRRRHAQL